jgi:hypothetical protein
MATLNLVQTASWFIRCNYWDQDVTDRKVRSEEEGRAEAKRGSRELRADIDVIHGIDVVACYRDGKNLYAPTA